MISDKAKNHNKVDKAQAAFKEIFSGNAIQVYKTHKTYRRIFTPLILIWCLIFQRLNGNHSCDAVVSKLHEGGFDSIEEQGHKALLSQRCLSESTAGYCKARKRLPVEVLEQALSQTVAYTQSIPTRTLNWLDRMVYLLDGSTLLLRPTPELVKQYGQHKTDKKLSYWVVMRVACLFCLQNGIIASFKAGSLHTSELVLGADCLSSLLPGDICVADRGFGMFRMVQAVRHFQGEVLFRLTRLHARALFREQLYPGNDLSVTWSPSKKDTLNPIMSADPIPGRLIYVRLERPGFRSQDLYLFTTLLDRDQYTRARLIELYGLRWHVELDLRYVKQTLDLHLLESKSVDVVHKELLAGMIAYNLVRLFMILSASPIGRSVLTLSFSMCRRRVSRFLFPDGQNPAHADSCIQKLLTRLAQCKLPNRPKPRIEPRWVRPKPTYFKIFWHPRPQARAYYLHLRFSHVVY